MNTYLPIGSVVLLEGERNRVMIYGRHVTDKDGKSYDYMACPYPEGCLNDGNVIVFNREDIAMIFFIGFQDIEELAFRQSLVKSVNEQTQ